MLRSNSLIKINSLLKNLAFCCLIGIIFPANALSEPKLKRIIVKFKDTHQTPAQQLKQISKSTSITISWIRRSGNQHIILLPTNTTKAQIVSFIIRLNKHSDIAYAEFDKKFIPQLMPNDSQYINQWYLFDNTSGINIESAWDITTGTNTTNIAILDSGKLEHEDLSGKIPSDAGYDFISEDSSNNYFTANDGNGRDADPTDPGDAVVAGECGNGEPAQDQNSSWHGLKIAGIIGASSGNSLGIAGINWQTQLIPVRTLGKCGGYLSDIADAIRWSAGLNVSGAPNNAYPAKVINLSISALETGDCSLSMQTAIDDAVAAGSTVVVSAGNDSVNTSLYSPGNCNNIINVGGINQVGEQASFTNTGSEVDLSAPVEGININMGLLVASNSGTTTADTSTSGDQYIFTSGTSYAAAMTSGVISLMLAVNSTLTPNTIENILITSTRPFVTGTGNDCSTTNCGSGMLDAHAAVNAAASSSLGGMGSGIISFSQQNYCALETQNEVTITINRTGSAMGNIAVAYETRSSSATAGQDFASISGILSWADGDNTAKTITIPIFQDSTIEGTEIAILQLTSSSENAEISSPGFATISILSTNGNTQSQCPDPGITTSSSGTIDLLFIISLILIAISRRSFLIN